MFPNTVTTLFGELMGSSAQAKLLFSTTSDYRVLGINLENSSGAFESNITCIKNGATTTIADNYNAESVFKILSVKCDGDLFLSKTSGSGNVLGSVSYIPAYYDATTTASGGSTNINVESTDVLNYAETLFIAGTIIFLLSLLAWNKIFTLRAHKKL